MRIIDADGKSHPSQEPSGHLHLVVRYEQTKDEYNIIVDQFGYDYVTDSMRHPEFNVGSQDHPNWVTFEEMMEMAQTLTGEIK